ncbi:MAG: 4-hydroxy-3-methylbut-2-en-1-yl diphosphate synthase [Bacteroidetes bacterium]|nr:MAG: 4-hydroxy-3-methylbut-2-en-1-yl diphosphate synthase [Bacteroidota bacterium]
MHSTLPKTYCDNFISYQRWQTVEVEVGVLKLGANNPIRLQSMSSCKPMDTIANVEQSIRIIDAGGEMVRFTAPVVRDAENLKNISSELRKRGFNQPLVADIHFNPKAALTAANYVEKVRINPGNFAETSSSKINYSEEEYNYALEEIEAKFVELIEKCKANNVGLRIGSNHGSLSQRIMDRYGDTAEGMVEAAMEYLKIAVKHNFHNIVLSMKASNIRVMVPAYRMLSVRMRQENMNFPLHLGVTEAGEGEDGRIKSAMGIGALLEDGLGDTIRVSLTEDPEFEIPVAKLIAGRYNNRASVNSKIDIELPYNPYEFQQRKTKDVLGIGANNETIVVGLEWNSPSKNTINLIGINDYLALDTKPEKAFVSLNISNINSLSKLNAEDSIVLVFEEKVRYCMHSFRRLFIELINNSMDFPVILRRNYDSLSEEEVQIYSAIDFGSLLIDGFGDGVWLESDVISQERINEISLGILQASRSRITKTDYISCPSCGRTLFNIQEATLKIREKTSHLKGLKIAVMGCIVNGPGEMADADYGYVGAGSGRINLYKGKEVIEKGIDEDKAVDELISLIKFYGDWVEKNN